jgi:hypothetical protein
MTRSIPPRARAFYEQFVEFANVDDPFAHSYDRDRFYHFVWAAHSGRARFTASDLHHQLTHDDFSDDVARELASIYSCCREFLQARNTMPYVKREDWVRQGMSRPTSAST